MPTRGLPMVQGNYFFVGISSIYLCMAVEEAACLMPIMAMASYSYIITKVIMILLEGKSVDSLTANGASWFLCGYF
jgi:hypothetical protein